MSDTEKLINCIKSDFLFDKQTVFDVGLIHNVANISFSSLDVILRDWHSKGFLGDIQYAGNRLHRFKITPEGSKALMH